jgi:hypothetical protein
MPYKCLKTGFLSVVRLQGVQSTDYLPPSSDTGLGFLIPMRQ